MDSEVYDIVSPISGTNSGAPEVSEEGITSVDAEPEVNSKRQQDVDTGSPMETDSESEEIVEEGETDLGTRSARKRERRKTLKEYFLDSPPEMAVENAAMELQVLLQIQSCILRFDRVTQQSRFCITVAIAVAL